MDYRQPQDLQSLKPSDYQTIIVVFGSRYWRDKKTFHHHLINYLEDIEGPILFLSGGAPTGADDFIISWCKKFGFPCLVKPAKWQRADGSTDRAAGFKRNEDMAKIATQGLGFWDQKSPGTANMVQHMNEYHKPLRLIDTTKSQAAAALKDSRLNAVVQVSMDYEKMMEG
jgi:hypothetical protein